METGVSTPDTGFGETPVSQDLKEIRYVFNPYAVCNLEALSSPTGYRTLPIGEFVKIETVVQQLAVPNYSYVPQAPHSTQDYEKITRYPGQIIGDFLTNFSNVGVREITVLRTEDEDNFVKGLTREILGSNIPTQIDAAYEDTPCPNLPVWFQAIEANYMSLLDRNKTNPQKTALLKALFKDVRESFRAALKSANDIAEEATRRVRNTEDKRPFDARERRAFLAIGEEIPNQSPLVTKSANNNANDGRVADALVTIANNQQNAQLTAVMDRLDRYDAENARLREENERLRAEQNNIIAPKATKQETVSA